MKKLIGIEYGRGATARLVLDGPALAPTAVKKMFPDADWTIVSPDTFDKALWESDRFAENLPIQAKTYTATPRDPHVMIGGDHSLNFGHFAALADQVAPDDLCLIYIDAHLDMHNPASSKAEASGAPHGTNVRALTGDGDERWLKLQRHIPALKPSNLFYLASRSYEPSEIKFVRNNNVYMRTPSDLQTPEQLAAIVTDVRRQIGDRPFAVSFDFDAIDPQYFNDVLVPEPNGISVTAAEYLVREFARDAYGFEFVEYAPTGDKTAAEIVKKLVGIALGE